MPPEPKATFPAQPSEFDVLQGAPSPSGKAEVCKTSISGSNPDGASNFKSQDQRRLSHSGDSSRTYSAWRLSPRLSPSLPKPRPEANRSCGPWRDGGDAEWASSLADGESAAFWSEASARALTRSAGTT